MEPLSQVITQIQAAIPAAQVTEIPNPGPSGQHSLLLDHPNAVAVATFLRDQLGFDYCSNMTGVDSPEKVNKKKVKTKVTDATGTEKEVEQTVEERVPGYFEAVYHLYSIEQRKGPLVIRLRTATHPAGNTLVSLPSLTPVWRSAEFQEREAYDLYGIEFQGHPDLRRILMWDGYADYPMRKDYVDPDDYEYEPTPHDQVLDRAKVHYPEKQDDNRFAPQ